MPGLAKLEPETYNQLKKKMKGVHTAIYKKTCILPEAFNTWKEQGVLLNSIHPDLKRIFEYQWLRLQNIEDEDCFVHG
jgi:hypothetical protein